MNTGPSVDDQKLDLAEVSLPDLLETALDLNRVLAGAKGVRLDFNSVQSFPPLLVDPRKLTAAISALVELALTEAMTDTGVILMLAGNNETAELVLTWRGTAADHTNPSTAPPDRASWIISAHNGTLVRKDDDTGGGSLTITLPVIRPAMQMDARDTGLQDRDRQRHLHILLAEDSPMSSTLTASLLEKKGHSVTRVSNGSEAVNIFLVGHFDLVLMDLKLPLMGGLEATEAVRRLDSGRGRRVPIVALTASDIEINLQRCLDAGMDGMLNKPFKSFEFDLLLKQLKAEAEHTG